MMNIAILIAGLTFIFTACTSLIMYFKGYGKRYAIIGAITFLLIYLIFGIWNNASHAL
ncbi:putative transporter [Natronobacillus azotifigens]|uniref:Uncharacterized protein n=1 Tax=Natronobacillus azotifigens TaxID=472978 RepID=A0A9J6R8V2_9BACI|nr:hypothetical protein [Natronobacillus azotifigens]MCZ0701713.1 hypothetical protein [Natronobacillus azotifigens]